MESAGIVSVALAANIAPHSANIAPHSSVVVG
jgi:hypothetical protein